MKTSVQGIDFKTYNLKNLGGKKQKINESKVRPHFLNQDTKENMSLLRICSDYWDSLADFRQRRERARKYYRGDQWHELIDDPDNPGTSITEEAYIMNQGKVPLKQNVIRQLVKNLLGQYRSNPSQSIVVTRNRENQTEGEMMSNVLRAAKDLNRCTKLDARNWEEFMLSGFPAQKIGYQFWQDRDREDLYLENINPNRMFFNTDVSDVRLLDLNLIGEIRDVDLDDVISAFASNVEEAKIIKSWYVGKGKETTLVQYDGLTPDRIEGLDFLITEDDKCRVIEVWQLRSKWKVFYHDYLSGEVGFTENTLQDIQLVNQQRIIEGARQGVPQEEIPLIDAYKKLDTFWYFKFLTPFGHCLFEGESPYIHKSHPYSLLLYPMLDGEVWGLVEDIIDQQRYINRLITLQDFIMGSSAKGVLLIPEESIPEDMSIEEIADEWTKFNGVIKLKMKPGVPVPQQLSTRAVNIGTMDMLSLQMKLVQDIAGVSSAIQGQTAKSGTPSSLYAQEAQNSSLNTKDYMEEYNEFKKDRDLKALKVILQYYNQPQVITVPGARTSFVQFDPERIKNLEFDVVVTQSTDTPVYRQLVDDALFQLLQAGLIDITMYLENSSLPFADKLLTDINQRQSQMQGMGQVPPELINEISQAQQQIPQNPNTQKLIERILR